jgi:hypothetical protein
MYEIIARRHFPEGSSRETRSVAIDDRGYVRAGRSYIDSQQLQGLLQARLLGTVAGENQK